MRTGRLERPASNVGCITQQKGYSTGQLGTEEGGTIREPKDCKFNSHVGKSKIDLIVHRDCRLIKIVISN